MREKLICKVYGCTSLSSYSLGEGRSKNYCLNHSRNGLKTNCEICRKDLSIPANRATVKRRILCRSCSIKEMMKTESWQERHQENLKKINSNPKNIERTRKLAYKNLEKINSNPEIRAKIRRWQQSDEGLAHLKANSDKWRASERGKAHAIEVLEKHRDPDRSRANLEKYRNSDRFKNHIEELNSSDFMKERSSERMKNMWHYLLEEAPKEELEEYLAKINAFNFTERDGELLYLGRPWLDVIDEFKSNPIPASISDFANQIGGFVQPTYRTNHSNTSGQDLMEKELESNGITWFAYVKFYIDTDGNVRPIVVGKSGSKLVNVSGSDVNFSYSDISNKPGRKMLYEEGLEWYKDHIVVIPVKSKREALCIEANIAKYYNLFYS